MKQNALTPEQARTHPWRHVLSQCLGREDMGKVDILDVDIQMGDRLLLCSDGLTEDLSDTAIAPMLSSSDDCETIVNELVDAAKDRGGRDNITTVIVIVGNEK